MTSPETPHEDNTEQLASPERGRLKNESFNAAADLIESAAELAVALRSERMPDTSEYIFSFSDLKLSTMYRPDTVNAIIDAYGPLDELTINTRHQEGSPDSSFYFYLSFGNADTGHTHLLHVERPGHYSENTKPLDIFYENPVDEDGEMKPLAPIPASELSRMVASLIYPSRTGDWSVFDKLNLNDGTIYETLIDALQKHAHHYSGNELYELTFFDQSQAGRLIYSVDNGELITVELQRVVSSDIVIRNDTVSSVEHTVSTEIDLLDGASIQFYDIYDSDDDIPRRQMIHNIEASHYRVASEFAEHHTQRTNPMQTERITELNLPPYEQFSDDENG